MYMKKGCLSGSLLKMIAFITMAIDHVAASVLMILKRTNETAAFIYPYMRHIGRIAFPIFIFELVEGFMHTKNKGKYALRLFVFSLIAEVPFDLAFFQTPCTFEYQNVIITMFIGFLAMWGLSAADEKIAGRSLLFYYLSRAGIIVLSVLAGFYTRCDYSYMGVLAIILGYVFRSHPFPVFRNLTPVMICLVLVLSNPKSEIWCLFALPFLYLYSGKKGKMNKWISYGFYPGHLFLLYLILQKLSLL